jgi:hypothetical protein
MPVLHMGELGSIDTLANEQRHLLLIVTIQKRT